MDDDPFDRLLGLEDEFYDEGYEAGLADGVKEGRLEGRAFGMEKGFEKYLVMGRLHGRSAVWTARMPASQTPDLGASENGGILQSDIQTTLSGRGDTSTVVERQGRQSLPLLSDNPRLQRHINTLQTITDPSQLSVENREDAVADVDDRLKRARAKVKVIEKLVHEAVLEDNRDDARADQMEDSNGVQINDDRKREKGDGIIQDFTHASIKR